MTATTTRDHSYRVRLSRGDRVRFTKATRIGWCVGKRTPGWEWEHRTAQVGEEATVVSESNAGFRGIEAALRMDTGERVSSVSTGVLEKAA